MPVTFKVAPHTANTANDVADINSIGLLRWCSYEQFDVCEELLQSFIGRGPDAVASNFMGAEGGLVSTVLTAYNSHHSLVLRPDDVWLAILVQFSFYVNAHADELRDKFVAHEDKKEVVVDDFGTRYTVDHGLMARRMTEEMDKFIVDQAFKDWILPRFSTTTSSDVVVASIVMMATLKEYFIYKSEIWCGIPQVTLEGEKSDWEEILRRAEKLKDHGNDVVSWYALLEPVLTRFVSTFDAPESHENADFWRRIVHYSYEGSGTRYLSGWLTAFCAFDAKGKWLGVSPENTNDIEAVKYDPKAEEFLTLDGARYFSINTSNITVGHTTADVLLIDNGSEFKTQMVAGLVATRVSDSGDTSLSESGIKDTVSPVPGWWIFVRRSKGIMQAANEKQRAKIEAMYARWDAESAAKSESETTAHEWQRLSS